MAFQLSSLRITLYFILSLFAIVLLGLTSQRIHYTTHIPPGDPLNGGRNFYDPIVAELLATSVLIMLWSWFIMHAIYKRRENRFLSTFRGELIGSFILWIMILVGAAIASKPPWGNLSWCWIYLPCRVLTAMLAFAWLCFIFLTILIAIATIFAISNRAFNEPLHGRWDPRASHYGPSMSTRPTSYA